MTTRRLPDDLPARILAGERRALARAVTLVESTRPDHRAEATTLLEQLREQAPDYLLSSNIGCALHLAEGAKKAGVQLEVLHPVELLARQLPD